MHRMIMRNRLQTALDQYNLKPVYERPLEDNQHLILHWYKQSTQKTLCALPTEKMVFLDSSHITSGDTVLCMSCFPDIAGENA